MARPGNGSRAPPPSDSPSKRRRNRPKLSCVPCVQRKIKCDRNVPNCNSCTARGTLEKCRWGDERDEEHREGESSGASANGVGSGGGSSSGSGDDSEGDKDDRSPARKRKSTSISRKDPMVQRLVEVVVKTLERKSGGKRRKVELDSDSERDTSNEGQDANGHAESSSQAIKRRPSASRPPKQPRKSASAQTPSQSNDSLKALLHYDVRPPPMPDIKRIHTTAFDGLLSDRHFSFAPQLQEEGDNLVDRAVIASTLQHLPEKYNVQMLVEAFRLEVEPTRGVMNSVIFGLQLDEFWTDVEDLGLRTGTVAFKSNELMPRELASTSIKEEEQRKHPLCAIPRQGFIAVLFCVMEQGGRAIGLKEMTRLGILSSDASDADLVGWSTLMTNCARKHMDLSEYILRPTLWSVQAVLLNDLAGVGFASRSNVKPAAQKAWNFSTMFSSNMLAIYLMTSLGLNRLGSAVDDVQRQMEKRADARGPAASSTNTWDHAADAAASSHSTEQQTVLATISLGTWVTEFEEGRLAYRELGRKLWTSAVRLDSMMSTHFNQYHCVHDEIDQTAPPAPLNDEDFLSPDAAKLILEAKVSGAKPKTNTYIAFISAVGKVARSQVQMENRRGAPLRYSDLLQIDARFRAILDALPAYLSVKSGFVGTDNPSLDFKIALQRSMINDQCHFRILRLHRQHLGRGFRDKRYRRSAEACFEAANGILDARVELEHAGRSIRSALFLHSHLVHAALVFQVVLMRQMDRLESSAKNGGGVEEDDGGSPCTMKDFDVILDKLHLCAKFLKPGANNTKGKEFIPSIQRFLTGAELYRAKNRSQVAAAAAAKQKSVAPLRGESGATMTTTDAATLLASMPSPIPAAPSSVLSGPLPPPSWLPTPSTSMSSFNGGFDATLASSSAALGSGSDFDPSLWSLESLFPNYFTEGIDLIAALEHQVLTGGGSGSGEQASF